MRNIIKSQYDLITKKVFKKLRKLFYKKFVINYNKIIFMKAWMIIWLYHIINYMN